MPAACSDSTDTLTLPAVFIAGNVLHDFLGARRPYLTAKRLLSNQTFRDPLADARSIFVTNSVVEDALTAKLIADLQMTPVLQDVSLRGIARYIPVYRSADSRSALQPQPAGSRPVSSKGAPIARQPSSERCKENCTDLKLMIQRGTVGALRRPAPCLWLQRGSNGPA